MYLTCEECLNYDQFEEIASGEDEIGDFSVFECNECFHANIVYDE